MPIVLKTVESADFNNLTRLRVLAPVRSRTQKHFREKRG